MCTCPGASGYLGEVQTGGAGVCDGDQLPGRGSTASWGWQHDAVELIVPQDVVDLKVTVRLVGHLGWSRGDLVTSGPEGCVGGHLIESSVLRDGRVRHWKGDVSAAPRCDRSAFSWRPAGTFFTCVSLVSLF